MSISSGSSVAASASWPNLYEFLLEAELSHYYNALKNDLKIASISQLKYVEEDDLAQMGMSKPEQRRLRKFFNKYYPQNYIMKIKKMIKPKHKEDPDRTSILLFDSSADRSSVRVPSKHIISADTIVINKELGVGEFGVVQQGVWTNEDGERIQVAIKCLSKERMQNNYMEFLKEAAIMHTIDHEHIVRLYGVVLDSTALMLVTELAPLRSLLECLKEPALRLSFPVILLCDFALQICEGMNYLESKRLIHRDLAARNILVFAKNNVKISDFGLSRALGVGKDYYQTNFNVNLKLPIAWCAPECINYLRFTSASDVWAYGVTLWEMFSYGFQPWAAQTGQQILEAIDEPNFQRLEQPECCPKEYYTLMLKCWQHDPNKRPKFCEILNSLPDCKAEQVQAVKDCTDLTGSPKAKKEMLQYKIGDVITVLDKRPVTDSTIMWKGVLNSGKTGLFNPANTVAYLGQNLPTIRPNFVKTDGKSGVYASRRRLRTDMISGPQGDCKHTGHVGLDGAFFGDISFLGDKYHQLPKQVVTPYKPHEDREQSSLTRASSDLSDKAPLLAKSHSLIDGKSGPASETWSVSEDGKDSKLNTLQKKVNGSAKGQGATHEYHEISDDDLALDTDDFTSTESPQFESLDFGPSLMDEFLKAFNTASTNSNFDLDEQQSNESNNVRNEIKEITSKVMGSKDGYNTGSKKKQAAVKPISAQDQQTLESAIAMAKELASKSMLELDAKSGESDNVPDSPKTPNSPGKHRKFSFKFKTSPKQERRNFSEEAEAIPDIQDTLSEEAKEAYNSLVEKGHSNVEAKSNVAVTSETHQYPLPSRASLRSQPATEPPDQDSEAIESNPLRMLRTGVPVRPKVRGNKHGIPASGRASTPHSAAVARLAANASFSFSSHSSNTLPASNRAGLGTPPPPPPSKPIQESELKSHRENLRNVLSETIRNDASNPLPLPPRDRTKPLPVLKQHTRKYPLLMPIPPCSDNSTKTYHGKDISSPEITQQELSFPEHTYSNVIVKRDRNGSESSSISAPIAVPESSSPESPSTEPSPTSSLSSPVLSDEGKPALKKISDLDDSFETRIQAQIDCLDEIPEENALKKNDHVSCEDLLEFAMDKPNSSRTRGRTQGAYSDEVRIMQKVLAKEQVTKEACLLALNQTDWDVHKAIKYQRLLCVLSSHLATPLDNCHETLIRCNWDVQQAANFLLATNSFPKETSTEV